MMTGKDMFFDKLESYFDFRDAKPEDFSATALKNLARDLVQMCRAVSNLAEPVGDETHHRMIGRIVGEEAASVQAWGSGGYMLNEGARLLAERLSQKFGFR